MKIGSSRHRRDFFIIKYNNYASIFVQYLEINKSIHCGRNPKETFERTLTHFNLKNQSMRGHCGILLINGR